MNSWTAMKDWPESLTKLLGNRDMDVGKESRESVQLAEYLQFGKEDTSNISDPSASPLYIFDSSVFDDVNELLRHFHVPSIFPKDDGFMHVIFSSQVFRPEYRWLLIGHKNSGFGIHIDPFNTHAWNALIVGRKRWALFPPSTTPEVAMSCFSNSAAVWFKERDKLPISFPGLIEFEQVAGEIVFIPNSWWHVALCLELSIAVTYNYLGEDSLQEVILLNKKKGGEEEYVAKRWEERLNQGSTW